MCTFVVRVLCVLCRCFLMVVDMLVYGRCMVLTCFDCFLNVCLICFVIAFDMCLYVCCMWFVRVVSVFEWFVFGVCFCMICVCANMFLNVCFV